MREDSVTKEVIERRKEDYEAQIERIKKRKQLFNSIYSWILGILICFTLLGVGVRCYNEGYITKFIGYLWSESDSDAPEINVNTIQEGGDEVEAD